MYSQGICTVGQCLKNVKCETYLASNLFVVSTRFSLRYIQKLLLSCKSYRFLFRLDHYLVYLYQFDSHLAFSLRQDCCRLLHVFFSRDPSGSETGTPLVYHGGKTLSFRCRRCVWSLFDAASDVASKHLSV